ncbi:MAG: T9SS type A sorting domain-containing protein [Ignavibacteriae bacterium]|nr:T9SS type A sorting domain-containing protein [Ignavibacteriota bacterium]
MATNTNSGFVEYSFERIDSAQGKIYKYDESFENTKEFLLENLSLEKDQNFESFVKYKNELYETDIYFTSTSLESIFDESEKIQTKSFEFNCVYFSNYTLSIGIGKTSHFSTKIDGFDEYWILKAAFINGKIYGDTTLVGIESDQSQIIPTNFSLSQNYPNPFNPTTTIEYSVPNVETQNFASLQLVVYDILGSEVATLVNQTQKPGNYKIQFEGLNLPSGVYYYQLKSGNFSQTKKMIILK